MEQTLTLNSVSLAMKSQIIWSVTSLLFWRCHPHPHLPPATVTYSVFGLFVAPVVAFERHTVVSLCGLSEECFDRCQLNSHVLHDTHCAALYSKMWSSVYIGVHADFKLDVGLKGFCEATLDYSCKLHIKGRSWAFD